MSRPRTKRCAIYTRKSSDEGLEQKFNSLDAQREACAAYIASQTGEGWKRLPDRYDDGGVSGGTMDRPSLNALLADVKAGKVHLVVVYKIDRLTRSLADFARIVEIFDNHNVSFVSITQAFNTTSSMGRLTLNVLLSFAQFEREVTGERIRDKIAASKAKGMWMGGTLPLGYDAPASGSNALRINEDEAATVRNIFKSYVKTGSVHALQRHLQARGICSKVRVAADGCKSGGGPLGRGALFYLLRNRTYLGLTVHGDQAYPGQHGAIIDQDLFSTVQQKLDAQTRRSGNRSGDQQAPLKGRLFDARGDPMSPTTSRGSKGKTYRYYVSSSLQRGKLAANQRDETVICRIGAPAFEAQLRQVLRRLIGRDASLYTIRRIDVGRDLVQLTLPVVHQASVRKHLARDEVVEPHPDEPALLRLTLPNRPTRRGSAISITPGDPTTAAKLRTSLVDALRQAHRMVDRDDRGQPVIHTSPASSHHRRLVRLAFLAPDIQAAILAGRQPTGLTLKALMTAKIPNAWEQQRRLIERLAR